MANLGILAGQFLLFASLGTFASFLATLGGFGLGLSRFFFISFTLLQLGGWLGDDPIANALKWTVSQWHYFLISAFVAVILGVILWRF